MEVEKNEIVESDEEVYEVEKLMGHRHSLSNKNHIEYLIKWKDYSNDFNSWESEDNVFSTDLIEKYWNTQPYTLEEFRNKAHRKKPKLSSGGKKKPSPSTVMLDIERKQKLKDLQSATVSANPPAGLNWSDIESVNNVFHSGLNIYFAEVKWNRPDTISFVPTRLLRAHCPLKLIYFYESHLEYKGVGK